MLSPFKIRWATPNPSIHHMLLLGVSKKTYWCLGYNATVLDADSRVWMFTMHGRIQKILSWGWVSWKLYFSFFAEGSVDLASLSKQLDPRGPTSSGGCCSITVFLRKHITTCDLPGGMQTLCPHPRDTHMRCLANNLNSVARSVAYLLNMQADRRSHPAYFSWRIVSSPDDSRRPSCQLLV